MSEGLRSFLEQQLLRPRLRDRLRALSLGGVAPIQLYQRLPAALRAELEGDEENETLARRRAIEEILLGLDELVQEGLIRRRQVRLKLALVDVYWRS